MNDGTEQAESRRRRDVADDLRDMLNGNDGRTIEEMREAEPSYTFTVERINSRSDTHTFVYLDDSLCGGFADPNIQAGDVITVWDGYDRPLMGGDHHGWALNGRVVEWLTPWERVARRVEHLARYDRDRRERFVKGRAEIDAKYEALPAPLKARFERLRAEDPAFRVEGEAYEMAAAHDAPKIARALAVEQGWDLDENLRVGVGDEAVKDVVSEFMKAGYEDQKRRVPDLDDGHSGNTFGAAVHMAYGLLVGQKL